MDKKTTEIEDEVKLLKNQIKQVLLDIREHLLTNSGIVYPAPSLAPQQSQPAPRVEPAGPVPDVEKPRPAQKHPGNNGHVEGGAAAIQKGGQATEDGPVDLLAIVQISQCLQESVDRIGKKRLEGIIEAYEAIGGISPPLKQLLIQLIRLDGRDTNPDGITLMNCVAVLTELVNRIPSSNCSGVRRVTSDSNAALADLISRLSVRAHEASEKAAALADLM